MVRYVPITKFEGINENGQTYENAIQKDIESFINTFLFCSSRVTDKNGEIDYMNMANSSNARFVLSLYYKKELDKIVSENIAKELKQNIIDSIGLDQLLDINQ